MPASSHLVEGGGGPTVHEPDAAVAQNVVAADGAAGQVAGVTAGHHAERPGPGGGAGAGAGWPLTPTGLEVDPATLRGPVYGRGRAAEAPAVLLRHFAAGGGGSGAPAKLTTGGGGLFPTAVPSAGRGGGAGWGGALASGGGVPGAKGSLRLLASSNGGLASRSIYVGS